MGWDGGAFAFAFVILLRAIARLYSRLNSILTCYGLQYWDFFFFEQSYLPLLESSVLVRLS